MSRAERLMSLITLCAVAALAADTPVGFSNTRGEAAFSPEILTNEGIVALADAGFSDTFIAEKIMLSNRTRFNTGVEGLAYLRRNGIPQSLVQFVVEYVARPLTLPAPAALGAIAAPMAPLQSVQVNSKRRRRQAQPVIAVAPVYSTSPTYSYVPAAYGYGYYGFPAASYSVPIVTGVVQAVPVTVVAHHWWQ